MQVCEFASDFVSGLEVVAVVHGAGDLLLAADARTGPASVCLQSRCGSAATRCSASSRKRGWVNFLVWPRVLDSKKIDLARANKLGFVTNAWSRPNMVNIILTWINRDRIIINSPYFIEEMARKPSKKRKRGRRSKAAYGEHDDRIMALGFILFAFHIHAKFHSDKGVDGTDLREKAERGSRIRSTTWGFQGREIGPMTMPRTNWDLLQKLLSATATTVGTLTQPLAIDLFCGLGGWTEGLLAEGYRVVGFDNERHVYGDAKYPGQLVIQDVDAPWLAVQRRGADRGFAAVPGVFVSGDAVETSKGVAAAE